MKLEHQYIKTNGIELHVVCAGPKDGPVIVLLHGFPEFWFGWQKQIEFLVSHGYRVLAPDQRGYNLSEKPKGIAAYEVNTLALDIIGLLDFIKQEKVFLVGHDWGAIVAWRLAENFPQRFKKQVVINVPHHTILKKNLRENWRQKFKSAYMWVFKIPFLPEWLLSCQNFWLPARAMQKSSLPGTFSQSEWGEYRKAWAQPGAWTGMLNWYRSFMQKLNTDSRSPENKSKPLIKVPTLLIWGKKDQSLGYQMAQPSIELCQFGKVVLIEDATHWVHHEKANEVNSLILDFIK